MISHAQGTNVAGSTRTIRELNDVFRQSMDPSRGRVMLTDGIVGLPNDIQALVIRRVATFDAFDHRNDPHSEHDFGAFDLAGHTVFWKIDYYDHLVEHGSEDPTDPERTMRVLTIMLAQEY